MDLVFYVLHDCDDSDAGFTIFSSFVAVLSRITGCFLFDDDNDKLYDEDSVATVEL